jgi:hypothetical protein
MNSFKTAKVIFFLFFAWSSCKNQNLPADNLLISLEKTPCFGTCPAYKLEIFSSGLVLFNGTGHHEMIGKYKSQLDPQALQRIVEKFKNSDFFSFKNVYTADVHDLPTTYLFFKDNGKEKMIQDYYNAPQKLKELEKFVEDIIPSLRWKKAD